MKIGCYGICSEGCGAYMKDGKCSLNAIKLEAHEPLIEVIYDEVDEVQHERLQHKNDR